MKNALSLLKRAFVFSFLVSFLALTSSSDLQAQKPDTNQEPAPTQTTEESAHADRKLTERIIDFIRGKEEDSEPVQKLAPVTVIASRLPSFKTRLTDIPANISYIPANISHKGRTELNRASKNTLQSSLNDIEGAVFYDQIGNGIDTTFSLRGFSEGSSVIVLVDGVRVNELDGDAVNYPLVAMNDIESIQVERGSASPVYGSGTFAGVVHITTRQPSEKPISIFGGTEWSSHPGVRFNNGISGTLNDNLTPIHGKFKYYFNMGRDLNDGFRDNGQWRITSLDIKLGYDLPEDSGSLRFGIKHIDNATSNPGALTIDEFHASDFQTTNWLDGRDFKNTIIQLAANKKFWDGRFIASALAYWRVNLIHFYSTSRTFTDGAFDPDTDLVTVRSRATDFIWQLGYQDKWHFLGNETHVGMELRDASQHDIEQDAFNGNVVETSARETERTSKPEYFSLYWREKISLFEKIVSHFGMRHDWHTLRTDDQLNNVNDLSRRWRNSSFSAGITLKPFEFLDLFGNYSQGFRAPTISEVAPFSTGISSELEPEKTDSYEIGGRFRYEDLFQGKFSYFLIDVKDEILFDNSSITTTTPFGQNVNAGKSRRTGIETRLDAIPIPEVDFYGSYTWTKAYIRETDDDGVPFDGRALGLIPKHRFTFGATLRPLYQHGSPWDQIRLNLNGTYTGEQFIQDFESTGQGLLDSAGSTIDAYMIWDGTLSFEWKGKQIYLKVNNIFDNKYYSRAVAATAFAGFNPSITPAGNHLFVNPGARREFLVGAHWEFGS
jgi:outer membrane receptor protein involved in Fe transport